MRIHHLQQVLRETGKLRVQLQLNARGEERERLQQSLDVGIGAFKRLDAEAARDLRKLPGKLLAGFSNILQFAVVVGEQPRVH